jgi:hypothetical protein
VFSEIDLKANGIFEGDSKATGSDLRRILTSPLVTKLSLAGDFLAVGSAVGTGLHTIEKI